MAFTCDLHQLINAYLRRDNGCKTAFSQLNELHQQNYLAQPLVEQESLHEGLWRVVVHTSSASLGEITMEGQGTRKAVAKEQAAQLTLDEIRRCIGTHVAHSDIPIQRSTSVSSASSNNSSASSSSSSAENLSHDSEPTSLSHHGTPLLTHKQEVLVMRNQQELQLLRELAAEHGMADSTTTYVTVDVEVWDQDTKAAPVLEIGIAWVDSLISRPDVSEVNCQHYIIQENSHLRNGRFCADNRDRFNFGVSEWITMENVAPRLGSIFSHIQTNGQKICLVGHNIKQDVKWLESLNCGNMLQCQTVCDIGFVFQAQRGLWNARKLSKMMDFYQIGYSNLHNGANDAFYTLELFLCMMEEVKSEQVLGENAELNR